MTSMLQMRSALRRDATTYGVLGLLVGSTVGVVSGLGADLLGVTLALGLILVIVSLHDWENSLYFSVFLLPFEALPIGPAGGAVRVALVITALGWIAELARSSASRHRLSEIARLPETSVLGVLLVWVSVSTAWAVQPSASIRVLSTWYGLALLTTFVAMLTRKQLTRMWTALVTGAAVAIPLSFLIGATGDSFAAGFNRVHIGGTDPNEGAVLLGIIIVVTLAYAFVSKSHRIVTVYLALFLGAGIVLSGSRAGIITLGFIGVATLSVVLIARALKPLRGPGTQTDKTRALVTLLLGAAALSTFAILSYSVVGPLISTATANSVNRIFDLRDFDANTDLARRPEIWKQSLETFGRNPILGVGIANSAIANVEANPGTPYVPHNSALTVAVEVGIIGLAMYLIFWIGIGRRCVAMARRGDPIAIALSLGALVWIVAGLSLSLEAKRFAFLIAGSVVAIWLSRSTADQ